MPDAENSKAAPPKLDAVSRPAAHFAMIQAHLSLVFSSRYRSAVTDIAGGLEAGQYGMVALQCRGALEAGVDVYLAAKGRFFALERYRWAFLAEVCGEGSDIYQEAWRLECENPETGSAVNDYAIRCRRFVEQRLELRPPMVRDSGGMAEERARFEAALLDIAVVAAFLGIDSPLSGTRFEHIAKAQLSGDR